MPPIQSMHFDVIVLAICNDNYDGIKFWYEAGCSLVSKEKDERKGGKQGG